ncbi:MAG: tRNA threonylcarbamoyladenosine dehydratase [Firmicutes bacterium]|nr:tRNA threonylcarbamoyladenosine dehydratase [Bacillota bacterium]
MDEFSRTELLLGSEAMRKLASCRVAVFGIGGVGGYVVEALARSGVGALDLVDNDTVSESNINRQIIALHSTVGRDKVDVAEERVLDINPGCTVRKHKCVYLPETADQFDFTQYDYIVDAIDTVSGKLNLVEQAMASGTPIISAMGAGNKLDASAFRVADISKTAMCPLAKVMRKELGKRGIKHLKVVFSEEKPLEPQPPEGTDMEQLLAAETSDGSSRRSLPGSAAFVPSVCGLIIAGEVVKDLIRMENE